MLDSTGGRNRPASTSKPFNPTDYPLHTPQALRADSDVLKPDSDRYYAGLPFVNERDLVERFIAKYELADTDTGKLDAYDELIGAANVNRADLWWRMARDDADAQV